MADGRRVQVVVDVVSGKTNGRQQITDIERDVIASGKRVEQARRTTDRVIMASQNAVEREAKRAAKAEADAFIRELKRIEHERKRLETETRKSLTTGGVFAGSFLGSVTAQALSTVTSLVQQGASVWLDYASNLEQARIGFTTMIGSAQFAEQHLKELQKFAATTPFEFEQLVIASQKMQGVGIEAKKVIPILTDVGNALAASGRLGELDFAIKALGDIQAKGKLAGQEIIQLANAGLPAIQILSQALGKTSGEILKMSENGEISADTLFKALHKVSQAKWGDAMVRQSHTFRGAMSNLKDITLQTANTALEPLYREISRIAVRAGAEIQKQRGDLSKVGQTIGQAMGEGAGIAFGMSIVGVLRDVGDAIAGRPSVYGGFIKGATKGLITGVFNPPGSTPAGPRPFDYRRPQDLPRTLNAGGGANAPGEATVTGSLSSILKAMRTGTMGQESGGRLRIINPDSGAGGHFQVMAANIGPWTQKVFGQPMSQQDFLSSPKAQETVFNFVMGQYLETAMKLAGGNKDVAIRMAAAAWYGGEKAMGRYNDPTPQYTRGKRYPSFAEYTGSVLARTKRAQLAGDVDYGDIQEDIQRTRDAAQKALQERSDAITDAERNKNLDMLIQMYIRMGLIPTPDLLKDFEKRLNERLRDAGARQGIGTEWQQFFERNALSRAGRAGEVTTTAPVIGTQIYTRDDLENAKRYKDALSDLNDTLFNVTEHTEEENIIRRISLGLLPGLNKEERELLILRGRQIDEAKRQRQIEEEQRQYEERVIQEIEQLKREQYQKTRDAVEESIDYLTRGDFKGLARSWMERQRRAFVTRATDWVMDKLGIENPDNTPELIEAKRQTGLLKQIAINTGGISAAAITTGGGSIGDLLRGGFGSVGGGIGPGGTPYFNPTMGGGGYIGGYIGGSTGPGGLAGPLGPSIGMGRAGGGGGFSIGGFNLGGLFGSRKNILTGKMSSMAGKLGGIGDIASMAGGMIGGKWGNLLSMTGTGLSIGANFGPWGALIGAGIGAAAGFISMLFGGDNAIKKIKEAALSTYGITIKDKSTLNAIKAIGETYFGKGKVGKNAMQLMQVDEVKNIIRNYAEVTGQNGEKVDMLSHSDENWKGNQFRSRFGGFRSAGGPVRRGYSYVVGERRPEIFTPSTNGIISPTMGDPQAMRQFMVILGSLEETVHGLATRLQSISPGHVLSMGVDENPEAVERGYHRSLEINPRGASDQKRRTGEYV